jgi:hypothetical protein
MLNIIAIDIWDILKSALFCVCLIIIATLLFKWMWLDHLVFDLPRGSYRFNNDFKDSMKVGTLTEYVTVMWTILWELDIPYWLDYVGLEGNQMSQGYSFIYFVRSMMAEMLKFFCFWCLFTLSIYFFVAFYAGNRLYTKLMKFRRYALEDRKIQVCQLLLRLHEYDRDDFAASIHDHPNSKAYQHALLQTYHGYRRERTQLAQTEDYRSRM